MNRLLRALMMLVTLGSLVAALGAKLALDEIKRPANPANSETIDFEIAQGETASEVADRLKQQDLIRQPILFKLIARQRNVANKLEAGPYQLRADMTTSEIISALQDSKIEEQQITIKEGVRLEEIAQVLVDAKIAPSTDAALAVMKNAEYFKKDHQRLKDIPADQSLEGYLFPDTYQVFKTATITQTVDKMLDEFDTKYETFEKDVLVPDRKIHEIVTMASIIQREAANDDEMPHVAQVLWNRLKPEYKDQVQGKLQADPTVQYAAGYDTSNQTWWRKNIDAFLNINSPYNTRANAGLPPGPIAAPSLKALRSAARPGQERPGGGDGKKDLYFVARCGGGGTNFTDSFEEFGKLEAEYQQCAK